VREKDHGGPVRSGRHRVVGEDRRTDRQRPHRRARPGGVHLAGQLDHLARRLIRIAGGGVALACRSEREDQRPDAEHP